MIFVDTNLFMYAVGRAHPLREAARSFFEASVREQRSQLVTSAEVMQELLHAYLPVNRIETLEAAWTLVQATTSQVFALEPADVELARALHQRWPGMGARDLIHLACCRRRGITTIKTFDRALAAASG